MDAATPSTMPFPALLQGLRSFRAHVGSREDELRKALVLPGQPALARDTSLAVLGVVRDLLVWLRDGIVRLQDRLVSIDALLAVAEVVTVLLQELGGALATSVPSLASATTEVTDTLSTLGAALDGLPDLAVLPEPRLVTDLRLVLELLVGAAEGEPATGSLDQLLTEIQGLGA
jgi:hypothetical protein